MSRSPHHDLISNARSFVLFDDVYRGLYRNEQQREGLIARYDIHGNTIHAAIENRWISSNWRMLVDKRPEYRRFVRQNISHLRDGELFDIIVRNADLLNMRREHDKWLVPLGENVKIRLLALGADIKPIWNYSHISSITWIDNRWYVQTGNLYKELG